MPDGERGPIHAREQRAAKCCIDIGSVERHQLDTGDVIENRPLINQGIADQVNFAVVIAVHHLPDFVRCRTATGPGASACFRSIMFSCGNHKLK